MRNETLTAREWRLVAQRFRDGAPTMDEPPWTLRGGPCVAESVGLLRRGINPRTWWGNLCGFFMTGLWDDALGPIISVTWPYYRRDPRYRDREKCAWLCERKAALLEEFEAKTRNDIDYTETMRMADEVMERYKNALQELGK